MPLSYPSRTPNDEGRAPLDLADSVSRGLSRVRVREEAGWDGLGEQIW
jgi:hypothetical protein